MKLCTSLHLRIAIAASLFLSSMCVPFDPDFIPAKPNKESLGPFTPNKEPGTVQFQTINLRQAGKTPPVVVTYKIPSQFTSINITGCIQPKVIYPSDLAPSIVINASSETAAAQIQWAFNNSSASIRINASESVAPVGIYSITIHAVDRPRSITGVPRVVVLAGKCASVDVEAKSLGSDVTLNVYAGGSINAYVESMRLYTNIYETAGRLILTGVTSPHYSSVQWASGQVMARDLRTEATILSINGSASYLVRAKEAILGNVYGSAVVYYNSDLPSTKVNVKPLSLDTSILTWPLF